MYYPNMGSQSLPFEFNVMGIWRELGVASQKELGYIKKAIDDQFDSLSFINDEQKRNF